MIFYRPVKVKDNSKDVIEQYRSIREIYNISALQLRAIDTRSGNRKICIRALTRFTLEQYRFYSVPFRERRRVI